MSLQNLVDFVEVNRTGFRKALKKHDKVAALVLLLSFPFSCDLKAHLLHLHWSMSGCISSSLWYFSTVMTLLLMWQVLGGLGFDKLQPSFMQEVDRAFPEKNRLHVQARALALQQ